LAVLTAK